MRALVNNRVQLKMSNADAGEGASMPEADVD